MSQSQRLFAQTQVSAYEGGCRRCRVHARNYSRFPPVKLQGYRFLRAGWVAVWTSFSLRMDTRV